jgi:hypothetical protein
MTARDDLLDAGADVKRTAALHREARSVLRRLDTLTAQAMAMEDDTVPRLAEARDALERVVWQLAHRQVAEQRRARAAVRRLR